MSHQLWSSRLPQVLLPALWLGCAGGSGPASPGAPALERSRVADGVYRYEGSAGNQRRVAVQGRLEISGLRITIHPREGTCTDLSDDDRIRDPINPSARFRCGEAVLSFSLRGPFPRGSFSASVEETRPVRGDCMQYSSDGRTCLQYRWTTEPVTVGVGGVLNLRKLDSP